MNDIGAVLRKAPDTPAGRQMKWYVEMLLSRGENMSSAERRQRFTPEVARRFGVDRTDEEERAGWRGFAARMGEIFELVIEPKSDFAVEARLTTSKDRKWLLSVEVEPEPPHRICRAEWQQQFEFKLSVREATEADASILSDIEQRCPIVLGDKQIYFDRGKDYFAFTRLMEDCTIGIASVDGIPAAVSCGARRQVRIGGVMRAIVTVAHLRVLPEHQRKGLWGAANRALEKYWAHVDGSNAYISVDNTGMQHGFINTPNKWPMTALRVQLLCRELAGPLVGRAATPTDAPKMVEMLNSFHESEEMYVPYTADSLVARLERAPGEYSWDKMRMTDNAMVGVWPAGESLRVVSSCKGHRTESVRGLVLDYAFVPGAEDEFDSLLRAWCGALNSRGMDMLSIFTSPASPGAELLRCLGCEVEAFNMWSPGIGVPPGAEAHGLYVDPIYF